MNVKPGDLARIIAGLARDTIVEVLPEFTIDGEGHWWHVVSRRPVFTISETTCAVRASFDFACLDTYLRPINGEPIVEDAEHHDEVAA